MTRSSEAAHSHTKALDYISIEERQQPPASFFVLCVLFAEGCEKHRLLDIDPVDVDTGDQGSDHEHCDPVGNTESCTGPDQDAGQVSWMSNEPVGPPIDNLLLFRGS